MTQLQAATRSAARSHAFGPSGYKIKMGGWQHQIPGTRKAHRRPFAGDLAGGKVVTRSVTPAVFGRIDFAAKCWRTRTEKVRIVYSRPSPTGITNLRRMVSISGNCLNEQFPKASAYSDLDPLYGP